MLIIILSSHTEKSYLYCVVFFFFNLVRFSILQLFFWNSTDWNGTGKICGLTFWVGELPFTHTFTPSINQEKTINLIPYDWESNNGILGVLEVLPDEPSAAKTHTENSRFCRSRIVIFCPKLYFMIITNYLFNTRTKDREQPRFYFTEN